MKKLMFAAAVAAGFAVFGVESSNVVGYMSINDNGNHNPGVGGLFVPVSGSTYKLSSLTVSADGDFMTPGTEYLQMLNPNGSAVTARYTYVSEDFLKDEFEDDWEDYKGAIGWWIYDRNVEIPELIEAGNYANKLTPQTDPDIVVGTAFLGALGGNALNFISSGEVPAESTAFNDNGNHNPFFMNYLPVTIDLMDITVSADGDFMTPGTEYLQVLNPNGSAVVARYTYVSEDFLKDEYEDEWEQYEWAIGWWIYDRNVEIPELIEAGQTANQLKRGDVTLAPGASFLGALGGNGLNFNFPAAYSAD